MVDAVTAPRWMRADGVTRSDEVVPVGQHRRFGWLSLGFAAWMLTSLLGVTIALDRGLTSDVTLSAYHVPYYLGAVALVGLAIVFVVRARRRGDRWQAAFPPSYGVVGAAAVLFAAWPIVDVGWRDGIGLNEAGIERLAAPSRFLLFGALVLLAGAPLRAALRTPGATTRTQAALSGALVFAVVGSYAGLASAANLWLERPLVGPEDNSEVWVMNSDGSHQTRLLEADADVVFGDAVWAPDGSRIAFTQARRPARGGPVPDVDIWVASADGSDRRELVAGVGWQWLPQWSPDGQWILYTIDPPGGPGSAGLSGPQSGFDQGPAVGPRAPVEVAVDVWRTRADGTGVPEQLTNDPADDRAGVYSPDGRWMLFDSTREGGRPSIYVTAVDGSRIVRATSFGDDWGGTWSPDGSRIAFNSWRPDAGGQDLYVVAWPALGEPARITTTRAFEAAPSWSPDGARLAFSTDREGHQDIWSVAADGTDPVNLTRTIGPTEALHPGGGAWGRDGRIVYTRSEPPDPTRTALVREDLAAAWILVQAILAAIIVLLVVAAGARFGAITLLLGLQTLVAVANNGEWRFVVGAVAVGLLVDVLVRLAPAGMRRAVAGSGTAAAVVLAPGITVLATTGLFWTPTLLLGVAMAAAAFGWAASGVVGRTAAVETPSADA
jgi:hypothetical protein